MVFSIRKNIESWSDEDILKAWKKSPKNIYWATLYQRYAELSYGVCLKYFKDKSLAEDALMEVFEGLPQKVSRSSIEVFRPWLYVVLKNHCLMQLRKKQLALTSLETHHDYQEGTVDDVSKENLLAGMEACMLTLNKEQRLCVKKFYLERKSYDEIHKETGFDLKKVKSFIQNGKRNLKNCMEKKP